MPLAHESKLLKRIGEEREHKALKEAYEAAKPFLRHWMRLRDRMAQRPKGIVGTHVEFPFFVGGEGLWTIRLPWTVAQQEAEAAKRAAKKRRRLRRMLKSIMSTDGPVSDDGICPKCKGLGEVVTRIDSEQCPDCGGDGWMPDEGEDDSDGA